MFRIIVFIAFMLPVNSYAVGVDKVAHAGLAWAATHACQKIVQKTTESGKVVSTVVCVLGVNAAGAVKEAIDPYNGGKRETGDLIANGLGSLGATITILW